MSVKMTTKATTVTDKAFLIILPELKDILPVFEAAAAGLLTTICLRALGTPTGLPDIAGTFNISGDTVLFASPCPSSVKTGPCAP